MGNPQVSCHPPLVGGAVVDCVVRHWWEVAMGWKFDLGDVADVSFLSDRFSVKNLVGVRSLCFNWQNKYWHLFSKALPSAAVSFTTL